MAKSRRTETPRNQRPRRRSPALVSPFGIPLPRRPLYKERPKGETHPHFGEKGKLVLALGPFWGKWRKPLPGLPFGSRLCSLLFSPHRRPEGGRGGPPVVQLWPGAKAKWWLWILGPERRGLKAKGSLIFPRPPFIQFVWYAAKPPTFRNTPADLPPHPPPRGSQNVEK